MKGKLNKMKDRSKIIAIIVSVLACFVLLPQMRAAPTPEIPVPGSPSNTKDGFNALLLLTTGGFNTADGWFSQAFNQTGSFNTAFGAGALDLNGQSLNSAFGAGALLLSHNANANTAVGTDALLFNDSTHHGNGNSNTAVGFLALENNTDGDSNSAVGSLALFHNRTIGVNSGISNNAVGRQALTSNTTGSFNEAFGVNALINNTTASGNIAIGDDAGFNTTGGGNVAVGGGSNAADTGVTTGTNNVTLGNGAGHGITSSSDNTILGDGAGPFEPGLGDNNVYVGKNVGTGTFDNDTIRIADPSAVGFQATRCFIGGIHGVAVGPSLDVRVNAAGQLGTMVSSARFKKDIQSMDKTSEAIFSLRPVTFHYKQDITNEPEFGLIAEEVAKVNPDLIIKDKEGKPFTVRYEEVNVLLLNEFLKEHKKVEEQQVSISQLKSEMQTMVAQLKEQAAQIQKVSAQLEVGKPAPQVVANKP